MELRPGLKTLLAGKKISVVGDSISTYQDVSNNGDYNSTINKNKLFYGEGYDPNFPTNKLNSNVKLNETWWMRTINNYGMTLNVNNSYSGSWVTDSRVENVAACNTRAENLHTNEGVKPDIIATFIGTNDLGGNDSGSRPCNQTFDDAFFTKVEGGTYTASVSKNGVIIPTYFDEGYALMISKIRNKYPDADIFCFTIPESTGRRTGEMLIKYNNAIKAIAEHYGCSVVDLYESEFSNNYSQYTLDNLHPNPTGMDLISKEFAKALARKYLEK